MTTRNHRALETDLVTIVIAILVAAFAIYLGGHLVAMFGRIAAELEVLRAATGAG